MVKIRRQYRQWVRQCNCYDPAAGVEGSGAEATESLPSTLLRCARETLRQYDGHEDRSGFLESSLMTRLNRGYREPSCRGVGTGKRYDGYSHRFRHARAN